MRRLMGAAVLLAILVPFRAEAQVVRHPDSTPSRIVEFEDKPIDGLRDTPCVLRDMALARRRFAPIIHLRRDFTPELTRSTEGLGQGRI